MFVPLALTRMQTLAGNVSAMKATIITGPPKFALPSRAHRSAPAMVLHQANAPAALTLTPMSQKTVVNATVVTDTTTPVPCARNIALTPLAIAMPILTA